MKSLRKAINGEDYEFRFGARFVNELDNKYGMSAEMKREDGDAFVISFGQALNQQLPALSDDDTGALAKILYCAGGNNKPRPTLEDIYDLIDDEETDVEALCNEVLALIEVSNAAGHIAKKLLKKTPKNTKKKSETKKSK